MKYLLTYCGLVDARVSASEKKLPAHIHSSYQEDMYIKPDAFLFKFLKFERGFGT